MVVCGGCQEEVTDAILCSVCGNSFDYACAGITEAKYRRLAEKRKREWTCPTCSVKVPVVTMPVAVHPPIVAPPSTSELSPVSPAKPTLELIMKRLDAMVLQLAPLKSLEVILSDISELKSKTEDIHLRINDVECRVVRMEERHVEAAEVDDRLSRLEEASESREQWLRSNNVEIKGVPQTKDENLFDIISKVGTTIGFAIQRDRINFVTRVPSRDENKMKSIIICFIHRYDKENFVAAGRTVKNMSLAVIGMQGHGSVFVNDHLTVEQKQLLNSAKLLVKEKEFEFIWVRHAKIMVRRNQTSPIFQIKSKRDLSKIK